MVKKTHVIVGGGTSGLFLSNRLLKKDNVVVCEAGVLSKQTDTKLAKLLQLWLNIHSPLDIWTFRSFVLNGFSSHYTTAIQKLLFNRQINYVQGIGAGGSFNVNAMIWTLGYSFVYDRFWPYLWDSRCIDNSIRSVFNVLQPNVVESSGVMQQLIDSGSSSTFELDRKQCFDTWWDDGEAVRSKYLSTVVADGLKRIDIYRKVADSNQDEPGQLTVLGNASVVRVNFECNLATSVTVQFTDSLTGEVTEQQVAPAGGGEIILCAGVFESPRILLRSGFSRQSDGKLSVESKSRPVISTSLNNAQQDESPCPPGSLPSGLPQLDAIGENLQDHVLVPYILLGNWHSDWSVIHSAKPNKERSSVFSGHHPHYPLSGIHGWVNLDEEGGVIHGSDGAESKRPQTPCAQLLFVDGRVAAGLTDLLLPRFKGFVYSRIVRPLIAFILQSVASLSVVQWLIGRCFFAVLVCVTQPHSRGRLCVDPSRPDGPLIVDPRYLSDSRDTAVMERAFNAARRLVRSAQENGKLRCLEVLPGPLFSYGTSQRSLSAFIALFANTYFHACGTCAMATAEPSAGEHSTASEAASLDKQRSNNQNHNCNGRSLSHEGVVDAQLRVRFVRGLRIADASVIPAIPTGPIAALCMAIGDIAGQMILSGSQ